MTETKKEKIKLFCPNCNSIVESEVLFEYVYNIKTYEEFRCDGTTIKLTKCINCENPFLISEDFIDIEDRSFSQGSMQLFPEKDSDIVKNAPKKITKPYEEALKCYKANAYDACVIMCRKGIEAICDEKGEKKGNLVSRLKNLKNKNILEDTFYNWSNQLREIGNAGAHSHDTEINKQDAKDTLEFFEALILYLYHLVDKYNKLVDRRNDKKA